jgi:hypothetical protein
MTTIYRARDLFGPNGKLGVSRTVFCTQMIERPGKVFIPGTTIRRLKPVRLGDRAVGYPSDEVEALIAALKAERDQPPRPLGRRAREAAAKAAAAR